MRGARPLGLLACAALLCAFAFGGLEKGNRLYREGRYAEAVEAYRQAIEDGETSPEVQYNLGTALLQLHRYDEAEQAFQAALSAVEPSLRERTFYNLGNRFLEAGRASQDPEATQKLLDAAVQSYKQSLRLTPPDSAAKWNLELALREQKKQPQQPKQQGDQQQKQQGGGGGGGGQSQASPNQNSGGGQGGQNNGMTQQEAARLLNAIEQGERDVYRQSLKKGRQQAATVRNW